MNKRYVLKGQITNSVTAKQRNGNTARNENNMTLTAAVGHSLYPSVVELAKVITN
jgi:hypothetical protein